MNPVHTEKEVESVARKAAEALYGSDIEGFRIRTLLPFPNEQNRKPGTLKQLSYLEVYNIR